ncbi:MAG: 50S ribosomal protein L24 [Candidatus Omnitrophica bacterium]|nr:50S ribosomal protein L24 [Candidatus Omnitrophota bacterium]
MEKRNKVIKLHIKKGDTVKVLSGDDKGKVGQVLKVFPKTRKAIVEGVNIIKKRQKPMERGAKGQIIEREAPIYVCKLMLVNPATGVASRIRRVNGERVFVKAAKK